MGIHGGDQEPEISGADFWTMENHGNHKFKHPNSTQVWMVMMVTEETSLKKSLIPPKGSVAPWLKSMFHGQSQQRQIGNVKPRQVLIW